MPYDAPTAETIRKMQAEARRAVRTAHARLSEALNDEDVENDAIRDLALDLSAALDRYLAYAEDA